MNSREKILAVVRENQPVYVELPELRAGAATDEPFAVEKASDQEDPSQEFAAILTAIGGSSYIVGGFGELITIIKEKFAGVKRILSNCDELAGIVIGRREGGATGCETAMEVNGAHIEVNGRYDDPHSLADTDLAILRARFGVAENAAVWMTEEDMMERALPFICQHLAVIIDKKEIVATMHDAYQRIGDAQYGFGVFIAGPSKTADIEQSLVLGAHGPVSMTVFIVE